MLISGYDDCYENYIHPCDGCLDYIPPNGCKSNGGCGKESEARHDGMYTIQRGRGEGHHG